MDGKAYQLWRYPRQPVLDGQLTHSHSQGHNCCAEKYRPTHHRPEQVSCCWAEELDELLAKEAQSGQTPPWELDAFMKADVLEGKRYAIVTEYILRILGLDVRIPLSFAPAAQSVVHASFGSHAVLPHCRCMPLNAIIELFNLIASSLKGSDVRLACTASCATASSDQATQLTSPHIDFSSSRMSFHAVLAMVIWLKKFLHTC